MATSETTVDTLFEHRLAMMQARGFNAEEALTLCNAKKVITHREKNGKDYHYEVLITWHDFAKLQEAGATNDQVLEILA